MSSDKIFIRDLKVDTIIGVYDWEKHEKQALYFDIVMYTDFSAAATDDQLEKTVDYAVVVEQINSIVQQQSCLLIESLAETVAKRLLENFPGIGKLKLTLRKPGALEQARCAGVTIIRKRRSDPTD